MATPSTTIDCSNLCAVSLPDWESNFCGPKVNIAEIDNFYVTQLGNPLTDETDAEEWADRMALLAANPLKMISIPVVAEKPEPEVTEVMIEKDTVITTSKTFTISGESYQTSQANHEAYRKYNCHRKGLMWYTTAGGLLYGGNTGIECSIQVNEVISKSRKDLICYKWKITWTTTEIENRCPSPF